PTTWALSLSTFSLAFAASLQTSFTPDRQPPARKSFLRLQIQRSRIHAIAKPSRTRSIGKNMTKMRVAAAADNFGPAHSIGILFMRGHAFLRERCVKAGPASSRIVLGI